ncbi:hypothetical protein RI367_008234 [Sorochytrium milnesiophthora]
MPQQPSTSSAAVASAATRSLGSGAATPSHGSRTLVLNATEAVHQEGDDHDGRGEPSGAPIIAGSIELRGGALEGRSVSWGESVVDNEGLGRKKSKICCIFRKQRTFGESSSESDSSSDDDDDDDDSDSGSDGGAHDGQGASAHDCGHSHKRKHRRASLSRLTLRLKRQKSTYFIECDSTDTVHTLKVKLLSLITHTFSTSGEGARPPGLRDAKDIKLLVPKEKIATTVDYKKLNETPMVELEDKAVLDQVGVCDDAVLFAVFWTGSATDGKWESISIPEPDPLEIEADMDNQPVMGLPESLAAPPDMSKVDKGKGKV